MRNLLRSIFFLFIQLPLIGIVALGWDKLRHRPILALLLGALYESFAFLVSFGKKVWADLEKDAVAVSANWVRGLVLGFAPGFYRRYRKQIVKHHGVFNVRGLGLINTSTLPLDQVFVNLAIDTSNPQKLNLDLVAAPKSERRHQIWHFLRVRKSEDDDASASAFAIIGPPGCGKTTLLQHVAITFALNRQNRHSIRAFTPVLLFLRDHIAAITRDQTPLCDLVQDYFANEKLFPTLHPPPDWFRRRITRGRCMILLDGLDEVGDLTQRQTACDWIDKQIEAYSRCTFIVSSRPQGYRATPLQRAHVMEVQPFSFPQVKQFIRNWYLATELISSGNQYAEVDRQRAETEATDLILRVQSNPTLNALTVNPLLLTMIAMVHRYCDSLPDSRVELYGEICEVLLGRWRQGKGLKDGPKASKKLAVLAPLAAYMMEGRHLDITLNQALSVIADPLRRIGLTGSESENFLGNLQAESGLTIEREPGHWSFAHLTLQEYLTSVHWLNHKQTQDWSELISDSWWQETLRLYAAQVDATKLVSECLRLDTVEALALARDLLEEAREIDPEVRQMGEDRLIVAIESTDPVRRDLAARVLLSRRLRSLQRIDEDREIDLEYVTCAEFQLFLNDMKEQGKAYQPDYWTTVSFPRGEGLQPVKGLRPEAAVAFCDWLNPGLTSAYQFRIPYPDEANQYPARIKGLATWCLVESGFRLGGMEVSIERELTLDLKRFLDFPFEKLSDMVIGGSRTDEGTLMLALSRALDLHREFDYLSGRASAWEAHVEVASEMGGNLLAVNLARDLATYIQREFERRVDRDLTPLRQPSADLALARELALDIDLSRNFDGYFFQGDPEMVSLTSLIDSNLQATGELLSRLQHSPNSSIARRSGLLSDLLDLAFTEPDSERRRCRAKYCDRLLDFAQLGSTELWPDSNRGRYNIHREGSKAFLSGMRWWRRIAAARSEGLVTAWEGIRIVREIVRDSD